MDKGAFDSWAHDYDHILMEPPTDFPFEGYHDVLAFAQSRVKHPEKAAILDVGVGTGNLTHKLYERGARIYGLDVSQEMLDRAQTKMPGGEFFLGDMKDGVPLGERFDYIMSSYALHHLKKPEKLQLIAKLSTSLKSDGVIILADISFQTQEDHHKARVEAGDRWDHEEDYLVSEDVLEDLAALGFNVHYTQVSRYAGVLELKKR